MMNRKEWIEYFEAINNRKPTIQECQQALLNGEFVMEGRQANFTNSGKSVTEGVMPLPNQMTGQMTNPLMHSKWSLLRRKKFGKKTFIGLGYCFISCPSNKSWSLFVFFQRNKLGVVCG
ncbi:MAG: hypothetical protein ACLR70_03970 [Streptococcus thermophilus]